MYSVSRREFFQGAAALTAAMASSTGLDQVAKAHQQQARRGGANDQINVAVVGVNGRGGDHVGGFAGRNNCIVTHICDCDSAAGNRAVRLAEERQRRRPTFVQDIRRLLENRDIDIVSIATPNHWHALGAIWAMQAGKHVYVEKPVSHNIWEGRRIVDISRQTGKLCQTGTQVRSASGVRQAIEFVRGGGLGDIRLSRGLCYKRRGSIGQVGEGGGRIPDTVDYNLWCGPGPVQDPLRRVRLHYDWHWTWDYGNGDLGNQGIHQMDVARWALGKNELARGVMSLGGRFGYTDDGETANTQMAVFDYGNQKLLFEVRGLPTPNYRGAMVGNVIHCANGYLVIPGYTNAIAYDNDNREIRRFQGGENHYENFVNAVRNNRRQDLNADILEGHLSSALCHMANISYRLGTAVPFARQQEIIRNDREADDTFNRMRDHLREQQVNLANTQYVLGPALRMDPEQEQFINNEAANRLVTRAYRRGFEVPART